MAQRRLQPVFMQGHQTEAVQRAGFGDAGLTGA